MIEIQKTEFNDTTVTIELTGNAATILGFDSGACAVVIPKSQLFPLVERCHIGGVRVEFA
jgi:hypothetical protein